MIEQSIPSGHHFATYIDRQSLNPWLKVFHSDGLQSKEVGGWDGAGWMRTGGAKGKRHLLIFESKTWLKARQGEAMEEGGAALFKLLFHIKVMLPHKSML